MRGRNEIQFAARRGRISNPSQRYDPTERRCFSLREMWSNGRETKRRKRTESPSRSSGEELNSLNVSDVVPQLGRDDTDRLVENVGTHASDCDIIPCIDQLLPPKKKREKEEKRKQNAPSAAPHQPHQTTVSQIDHQTSLTPQTVAPFLEVNWTMAGIQRRARTGMM